MKLLASLATASVAGAIVLPDAAAFGGHVAEVAKEFIDTPVKQVKSLQKSLKEELEHVFELEQDLVDEAHTFFETQDHDYSDFTIYELISQSEHTANFSHLVDKHDDVVKLLNDSHAEYTLFVPTEEAFADIPEHHKDPSDEFVDELLKYHVANGSYEAREVVRANTLPTTLHEEFLGGEPQRLRTSFGLTGLRLNVYSKVVAVNIKAKNGYIHAVNRILVPPTFIGKEISLFPAQFSTLLLAYDKTDFVDFIHNVPTIGSTVFVPSNTAWKRLGIKANAFLFNTDTGKKYLKALLKYQIAANITVYSDATYYGHHDDEGAEDLGGEHAHVELHTLLEGKSLGLDIHRWGAFTTLVVNGYAAVGFRDGLGKNGVAHVLDKVPIPSHPHKEEYTSGEIDVEDLKERLEPYVTEDEWADL